MPVRQPEEKKHRTLGIFGGGAFARKGGKRRHAEPAALAVPERRKGEGYQADHFPSQLAGKEEEKER